MKDNVKIIEQLNKEVIDLYSTPEYKYGKKFLELKKDGIIKFVKNYWLYKKMKKYNHQEPHINEFKIINNIDFSNKKIVVYGALFSNYDSIKMPYIISNNCDYILFSDQKENSKGWNLKCIPQEILNLKNGTLINRYFKMHPYDLFPDYDYAIYVDTSIQIVSDLRDFVNRVNSKYGIAFHTHRYRKSIYEEIECCHILKKGNYQKLEEQKIIYKSEGFPDEYGMLECGVIVTDLKNMEGKKILDNWWNDFIKSASLRDQISLPYSLWKMNIGVEEVGTLGNNIFKNEKLRIDTEHK